MYQEGRFCLWPLSVAPHDLAAATPALEAHQHSGALVDVFPFDGRLLGVRYAVTTAFACDVTEPVITLYKNDQRGEGFIVIATFTIPDGQGTPWTLNSTGGDWHQALPPERTDAQLVVGAGGVKYWTYAAGRGADDLIFSRGDNFVLAMTTAMVDSGAEAGAWSPYLMLAMNARGRKLDNA